MYSFNCLVKAEECYYLQRRAKDDDGNEIRHVKFFTSVT